MADKTDQTKIGARCVLTDGVRDKTKVGMRGIVAKVVKTKGEHLVRLDSGGSNYAFARNVAFPVAEG
jgi:hypothetical protein